MVHNQFQFIVALQLQPCCNAEIFEAPRFRKLIEVFGGYAVNTWLGAFGAPTWKLVKLFASDPFVYKLFRTAGLTKHLCIQLVRYVIFVGPEGSWTKANSRNPRVLFATRMVRDAIDSKVVQNSRLPKFIHDPLGLQNPGCILCVIYIIICFI